MKLFQYLQAHKWTTAFGYAFFIGMMAIGYYYNLTFIQLGLYDLGTQRLGMERTQVAGNMAYLALITCIIAIGVGYWMMHSGHGQSFISKLRLSFGVVCMQSLLTYVSAMIMTEGQFLVWIIAASIALGIAVPATFSMTVDLIPSSDRGYVAAAITATAYFAAEVFSTEWTFELFRGRLLGLMALGTLTLGILSFARLPVIEALSQQHLLPEFAQGRFVRRKQQKDKLDRRLVGLIILMFGIYFVDSLGFLRLLETPVYMNTAWQSKALNIRLFIAWVHVIAALIAGVLYTSLDIRELFFWIFGIFGLTHLNYTFHIRIVSSDSAPLAMPMLYATAVSLYTVVSFAIWADFSTPKTISLNTALGVALSGWTATFLSTAFAIQWEASGMMLERHLNIVDSLAILFFLALILFSFFSMRGTKRTPLGEES